MLKFYSTILAVSLIAFSLNANAQENSLAKNLKAAITSNSNQAHVTLPKSTTADALKMSDESNIVLQGTLTNLGGEMYQLTDSTGNINVEIDNDEIIGINFNNGGEYIILGEIDRDPNMIKIETDAIYPVK